MSHFSQIKEYLIKIRESLKDPLCCLGITSVILLLILSFFPYHFGANQKNSLPVSPIFIQSLQNDDTQGEPFADSSRKAKPESPSFLLITSNSLKAASPPVTVTSQVLAALVEGYESEDIKKVIVEYYVEDGDSLWSIANKFNISLNTLLWANSLTQGALIKPGQKLIIPPVDGLIYYVKTGDTLSQIAKTYKGKAEEILTFNDLSSEEDIYVGDILIIPNGTMPVSTSQQVAQVWVPIPSSYFICPIASPCRITQKLHFYNAVDFSHGNCGDPILAAAGGQVVKVKLTNSTSRWAFGGAGNTIAILHPNGVVTSYGHIALSFVKVGDQVSQGQIIALMGGQPGTPGAGLSTGCHVHFGVSGARNPFSK